MKIFDKEIHRVPAGAIREFEDRVGKSFQKWAKDIQDSEGEEINFHDVAYLVYVVYRGKPTEDSITYEDFEWEYDIGECVSYAKEICISIGKKSGADLSPLANNTAI